ncbi:undecaprenyldiphospho-muramoylpentapeptide beta-N-acetylglucosaminyltransferase [Candidatus Parcubacteria bacterium]|nr:undecaprenyldiphospho-muramoylpentapeptide beta-N-acetylglucosaminyltransferase [Candidatus Parcubacteria bacterium]
MNNNNKTILLTGGGTGGSVVPVLAMVEIIKDSKLEIRNSKFFWIGTKFGPEKNMVERENIKFLSISSGKFRRYFSWQNFIDPFKILIGFFQSLIILIKNKPKVVISAGSFVSVPVVVAAWILRIPILIHQLDYRPGLANKLMAPFANVITVTFEKSLQDYSNKAIHIGAFIRDSLVDIKVSKKFAQEKLGLQSKKLTILVLGGGTGSIVINNLVEECLDELSKFCQIIHITGQNKQTNETFQLEEKYKEYKSFEFLNTDGLIKVFKIADLVVSRAGMGILIELSGLKKPSIIIPMPDSHQEDNAKMLSDRNAGIVFNQKTLTNEKFIECIKKLINDDELRKKYGERIGEVIKKGDKEKIVKIIDKLSSK